MDVLDGGDRQRKPRAGQSVEESAGQNATNGDGDEVTREDTRAELLVEYE